MAIPEYIGIHCRYNRTAGVLMKVECALLLYTDGQILFYYVG